MRAAAAQMRNHLCYGSFLVPQKYGCWKIINSDVCTDSCAEMYGSVWDIFLFRKELTNNKEYIIYNKRIRKNKKDFTEVIVYDIMRRMILLSK